MKRKRINIGGLMILPLLAVSAGAADISWTGGKASYTNAASWVGGVIPGAADVAVNDNGLNNAVQINVGNPNWAVNQIRAGNVGSGAFEQNGQTLAVTNSPRSVVLGVRSGSSGAFTMNGGVLNFTNALTVGELGTGALNVNGGAITGNGTVAVNIGTSLDGVSATIDAGLSKGGHTWFERGFYNADSARGLPTAGSTFTSETQADHSYTMAPSYTVNNTVLLGGGLSNATIVPVSPISASALSFLASAGGGAATINYTIHFAGGAPNESGSFVVPDWYPPAEATIALRVGGRVRPNGFDFQNVNDAIENPKILSIDVTVANTTSQITSIDLSYVSGGRAGIMAVSRSAGADFTPLAITGYNADTVLSTADAIYVADTVTDTITQTGGFIDTTGELWIGNYGTGVYTISGGTNNFRNWIAVGRSGGNGTLNMTGGELNKSGGGNVAFGTAHQNLSGKNPTGTFNHSGGVFNSPNEVWFPENSSSLGSVTGTYNISGTAVMNVGNWFCIGRSGGSGILNMTGGTINKTGGGVFIMGDNALSTVTQSAGSITANELWIGQAGGGNGTFDLSGTGSVTVSGYVVIGRDGQGTLNMSGGTFRKTGDAGSHLIIASGGTGNLTQTGGDVISTNSETWIAENGNATWTMMGGTATLSGLRLARWTPGFGTLNFNGGTMTATEILGGDGNATVIFAGGKLVAGGNNDNFMHDLDYASLSADTIIDTAGFNVGINQVLDGAGALIKAGAGTLSLNRSNTHSGAISVTAGKLVSSTAVAGANGYTVAASASLGVLVASDNAQLMASSVAFAGGNTLDVDLGMFGSPTAAPLAISGTLTANGTITVNVMASGALQIGVYPLVTSSARAGTGTFVVGTLPLNTSATIVDNGTVVSLDVTSVNAPRWEGLDGGNWDIGITTNWINGGSGLPTFFSQGSEVLFNDEALGVTSVNLVAAVLPTSVTVINTNLSYTISGSGKISGTTGLSKQGTGTLTIANVNDYTGATVISGGVLSAGNLANAGQPSAIGKGPLNLAGGTLSYTGPAAAIDRGYTVQANSSLDVQTPLTLSGVAVAAPNSGLIKSGPAQLTYTTVGSNYLAGAGSPGYLVQDGAVVFDGSAGGQTNVVHGGRLGIGEVGGMASVIMTNTTVIASDVYVGHDPDTVGSLTVENGANLTSTSWLILGDRANSVNTMTINGGTVNVPNGRLFLCSAPGTYSTLNINGGTLNKSTGDTFCIADGGWNGAGARTGIVNQVAGTVTIGPEVQIGQWAEGTGIWNLHGGEVTSTGWFVVGRDGGNGTFNIDGGTFTHTSSGQPAFIVGSGAGNDSRTSVGVLNHSGGTINCTSEYWIGENSASVGTNNISGTAAVNIGNWMSIGRRGLGVVNFLGGTITKTGGGNFIIGDNGTGIFEQSGGTLSINNEFWIGQSGSGNGTFNMSAGTTTVGSWVAVGRAGATGVWNMSGGSFTKTGDNGNHLIVGSGGPAMLNQTGGTITSVLSDTWVAENSDGTWTLDGGEAVLSVLHIAQNSGRVGIVNLNANGRLTATEVTTGNAGGNSTLNFNGGTLVAASGAKASFLHGLSSARVLSGGAIIDSGANIINVDQPLLDGFGGGGLTKLGTGTLNLNGGNTYTGPTLVNAGTLGGAGLIAGPVTVNVNGTLAPGTSIGTLTVSNDVTLGGTTLMEISTSGGDLLSVSGALQLGGTLRVVLTGTTGLAYNDTFNLFDWGTQSGSFGNVILPAGYLWDTSQLYVNGTIRVVGVSPAVLNPAMVVDGKLVLTGAGGPAGGTYRWLTQTNVAAPLNQWTTNSTGVFNSTGGFSNALPINVSEPARFYRLQTP